MEKLLTKNLLYEVEKFSGSELHRKSDLQVIVDQCTINHLESEFEELAFTAKYIEGLKRVLKKGSEFQEIENLDHVKKDLTDSMKKIIEQIKVILNNSSNETKNYFDETYLNLTPQCLQNLNELLIDFEWIKKYLNFKKHSL